MNELFVKPAYELLGQKIEAWKLRAEALVMIGQEESSAEKAIELLKEAEDFIGTGIARCRVKGNREI